MAAALELSTYKYVIPLLLKVNGEIGKGASVPLYDEPRVSQIGETVLWKRSETKWA